MKPAYKAVLLGGLFLSAILLSACDGDAPAPATATIAATREPATAQPTSPPTAVGPLVTPTLPQATATARPTTPVLTPTPNMPAQATADPAALTPLAGEVRSGVDGLVYINNGRLLFYDADHQDTRILVEAEARDDAPRVAAFVVAPSGDRLAYLLRQSGTVAGACRVASQLWLLSLDDITLRRQLAEGLLPTSCDQADQARAVLGGLAFAHDGGRLSYLMAREDGAVDLLLTSGDLTDEPAPVRVVTPAAGLLLGPRWSPDGRAIAFLEANDFGTAGSYDANVAVVAVSAEGAPEGEPRRLAAGHGLPGGAQALPPLDLTWLDADTLAFQAWTAAGGATGTWVVASDGKTPPRLVSPRQAGLAGWSGTIGQARLAYRIAGVGLALAGTTGESSLLAPLPAVGPTGPLPPLWSAGGEVVAFSTGDGALMVADRTAPGVPATLPLPSVLHAAWNRTPGDPPLLAALAGDGVTLAVFDRQGAQVATTKLPKAVGQPRSILWAATAEGRGLRRLAVHYTGGPEAGAPLLLLTLDLSQRTLRLLTGPPTGDGTPVWLTLGPLPEP